MADRGPWAPLEPEPGPLVPRSVNLIGFTLAQADWEHDVEELRRMLAEVGISVRVVLSGAGAY